MIKIDSKVTKLRDSISYTDCLGNAFGVFDEEIAKIFDYLLSYGVPLFEDKLQSPCCMFGRTSNV